MTPLIDVRLATVADAGPIARLSRGEIERGLPWRWTPQRVARFVRDRDTNVAVAREGSEGLAGFGIMQYAEDEAHLLLFAVHPRHRRRGVGTTILSWLETVALTAGMSRVLLECRRDNTGAREFYGALGYQERAIVRRMYSGLEDGVTLEKWLRR